MIGSLDDWAQIVTYMSEWVSAICQLFAALAIISCVDQQRRQLIYSEDSSSLNMLDILQSLSNQDLIIILSVGVTVIVFLTIIITVVSVYCCRRVQRTRGTQNNVQSPVNHMFVVEWYNVDRHALITLESCANVKGSVDLDYIMKMYK